MNESIIKDHQYIRETTQVKNRTINGKETAETLIIVEKNFLKAKRARYHVKGEGRKALGN